MSPVPPCLASKLASLLVSTRTVGSPAFGTTATLNIRLPENRSKQLTGRFRPNAVFRVAGTLGFPQSAGCGLAAVRLQPDRWLSEFILRIFLSSGATRP
jgi:hypothetical protein